MRWYLEPHRDDDPTAGDDDGTAPGLTGLPAALLQRHGARVLDPAQAVAISGQRTPRPTVYRARTLLIPDDLLSNPILNQALARVGLRLVRPTQVRFQRLDGSQPAGEAGRLADQLRQLPMPAVLVPVPGEHDKPERPVVVDAWTALQAIRAATGGSGGSSPQASTTGGSGGSSPQVTADDPAARGTTQGLDEADVRRISLEHLLVGSAITGSPASDGGGVSGSPASDGGGITGPGATDSYMVGGEDARLPVELCLDAPAREPADAATARWGRNPVIAVLDTGLRAHPWLGVRRQGGGYDVDPGASVMIDQAMQDAVYAHSKALADAGDQPRKLIKDPWDRPVTADPLVGELDTHTGHGTFIAGIVRQATPDANVLAVRIMHSDGIVYEGDLTCALAEIASRVVAALAGDMSQMVDVVSLSLGYFIETTADEAYSTGLKNLIDILLGLGVTVTAAAGNYSTSRRFYPAAFASAAPSTPGAAPLISVGALNPNGSKALFSDGGSWVTAWAQGAAVVSAFPADVNGSRDPAVSLPGHPDNEPPPAAPFPHRREALDPDDFSSGFAIWSGTSFSAPLMAAVVAGELLTGAAADAALMLNLAGQDAAIGRVGQAVKNLESLGWQD